MQWEKQKHHHLSIGRGLHLSMFSRETHYSAQFVSWLSLHLADFATRSFIRSKVHKFCEHLGEPSLPSVPLCNFLLYLPKGGWGSPVVVVPL